MEDIAPNIDTAQYGNQKGTGTEHLVVNMMDKILKLLDNNNTRSAVIASLVDWASAFDRQDPTLAIQKFIKMGPYTGQLSYRQTDAGEAQQHIFKYS